MTLKIEINQELLIPVEIGELKFHLDFSDKGLESIMENFQHITEDKVNAKNLKETNELVKKTIDVFLGEGSYDKVYEKYPSIFVVSDVCEKLSIKVAEEIKLRAPKAFKNEVFEEYLKKNNS